MFTRTTGQKRFKVCFNYFLVFALLAPKVDWNIILLHRDPLCWVLVNQGVSMCSLFCYVFLWQCAQKDNPVGPWNIIPQAPRWCIWATHALDDIHDGCRLFLRHFGPEVAFPAQAQMLPLLSWSEEFSRRLSLFMNGLGRLHPGSFILDFLQVAPPP